MSIVETIVLVFVAIWVVASLLEVASLLKPKLSIFYLFRALYQKRAKRKTKESAEKPREAYNLFILEPEHTEKAFELFDQMMNTVTKNDNSDCLARYRFWNYLINTANLPDTGSWTVEMFPKVHTEFTLISKIV